MKHTEYIIPIGEDAQDYDEMFIGVIRRQPELVRCKDCIYFKEVSGWHKPICGRIIKNINADDYCSYGVKMPPVATKS